MFKIGYLFEAILLKVYSKFGNGRSKSHSMGASSNPLILAHQPTNQPTNQPTPVCAAFRQPNWQIMNMYTAERGDVLGCTTTKRFPESDNNNKTMAIASSSFATCFTVCLDPT